MKTMYNSRLQTFDMFIYLLLSLYFTEKYKLLIINHDIIQKQVEQVMDIDSYYSLIILFLTSWFIMKIIIFIMVQLIIRTPEKFILHIYCGSIFINLIHLEYWFQNINYVTFIVLYYFMIFQSIIKRDDRIITTVIGEKRQNIECVVCIIEDIQIQENGILLPCGHTICDDCLENWIQSTLDRYIPTSCPFCRKEIEFTSIYNDRYLNIISIF